ncbi:MAG: carbohydrate binding family 9 domain-containing protein [Candidatus Latescibacteria bacterium]|nr:carbohydrate binding family 9 domain-containing protein [Candidatus Latescibacterota bacterium]
MTRTHTATGFSVNFLYKIFQLSLFFFPVTLITMCFFSEVYAQNNKTIEAVPVDIPVRIDGFLNDSAWETVHTITDFTQRELVEGDPPTEKTEVKVAYDEKNLYIGIICYDSEPDKIVHNELVWDGDLDSDDSFSLVLDTFNDQRTGYAFRINPNGARLDALIKSTNELNEDWNGIWDVAARITDKGWQAEIVIPFLSLRFPKTETQVWGINFHRIIRRKNEEVLWTSWRRDDGPLQLSKAGKLTGLKQVKRGKQAEFVPYLLSGVEKEKNQDMDDTFKYGLDVKYPVTSDLTLDFTANTDFAQVESDQEQINLTRFSLQYPEKRNFFLEGAEIFDFTQGGTKMYYSRRIGITPDPDRQEVPILGGVKLSGKSGKYQIGVMNMQTKEKTVMAKDGTKNYYPSTNYTVIRIKRDILKQSYIGFIGTMVNREDRSDNPLSGIDRIDRFMNKHENYMGGLDFSYRTDTFLKNKNLVVQGYFASSNTPGLSGDNIAGRLWIDYPNDVIDASLLYHGIDNNFNPEIGFFSRPGIQHLMGVLKYTPRVNIPHVKKLLFMPYEYEYVMDTRTKLLTRSVHITPFGILFESDDRLEFQIHNHYEWIDYDWNIFGNTIIKSGGYKYWHYFAEYESSKSRRVSFDLSSSFGDHYNGTRNNYTAGCTVKLNKYFAAGPEMAYTDITAGNGSFIARQLAARFMANLSTRLTSSTFVQWNNGDHNANLNFRIHYIPKIGSDVYIVYNQLWDEEDDYSTIRNTGLLKVDYLFRF